MSAAEKALVKSVVKIEPVQTALMIEEEIESARAAVHEAKEAGVAQSEMNRVLGDLLHWEDQYKHVTGEAWAKPMALHDEDQAALVSLFMNTHGYAWRRAGGWLGRTASARRRGVAAFAMHARTYAGVSTEEEKETARNPNPQCRVTGLRLADNNLVGPFPTRINSLKGLVTLDLSGNDLYGAIGFVGGMIALRYFVAADASLSGALPPSLGQLRALLEIRLSGNSLDGAVPWTNLANCKRLMHLDLARNQLGGPISPAMLELRYLQHVDLRENALTGALPTELGRLAKLHVFDVSDNQLTGPLPESVGTLTALKQLCLSGNRLSGHLPNGLIGMSALEVLYLHANQISGPLPPDLARLAALRYVNLSHNELTGPIPDAYCELELLETLLLNNNHIRTPYPQALGRLSSLRDFYGSHGTFSCELGVPRRFRKREFEARYVTGVAHMGLNSYNG